MYRRTMRAVAGWVLVLGVLGGCAEAESDVKSSPSDQQIVDQIIAKQEQDSQLDPTVVLDSDRRLQGKFNVKVDYGSGSLRMGLDMDIKVDAETLLSEMKMNVTSRLPGADDNNVETNVYMELNDDPIVVYTNKKGEWVKQSFSQKELAERTAQGSLNIADYLSGAREVSVRDEGDFYVLSGVPNKEPLKKQLGKQDVDLSDVRGNFALKVEKSSLEMRSFTLDINAKVKNDEQEANMAVNGSFLNSEVGVDVKIPEEALNAKEGVVF